MKELSSYIILYSLPKSSRTERSKQIIDYHSYKISYCKILIPPEFCLILNAPNVIIMEFQKRLISQRE